MRTIPIIVEQDNPVSIDLAIKPIQERLAELQYIDGGQNADYFRQGLIYGVAQRDEKKNAPILYWKNKEYFDPFFDNYKSGCWFYENDPRNVQGRSYRFNLNLVVWYQQQLFARHLNYSIREHFIDAILTRVLDRVLSEEDLQTAQVFVDSNQVFANYDIQKMNSLFKEDVYNCFRISFQHQEQLSCTTLSVNEPDTVADIENFALTNDGSRTNSLTWDAALGAQEYQIERAALDDPGNFTLINTVTDLFYDDTNLDNDYYYYRVRGVNGPVFGNYSNVLEILTYNIDQYAVPTLNLSARSRDNFSFGTGDEIQTWIDLQGTQDFNANLGLSVPQYVENSIGSNASALVEGGAGGRLRSGTVSAFNFMHQGGPFTSVSVVSSGTNNFLEKVFYSSQNNENSTGVDLRVYAPNDLGNPGRVVFTVRNGGTELGRIQTNTNVFLYGQPNIIIVRFNNLTNEVVIDVINANGQQTIGGIVGLPFYDLGNSGIPLAIGEGNFTGIGVMNTAEFQIARSLLTDPEVAQLAAALYEQYSN